MASRKQPTTGERLLQSDAVAAAAETVAGVVAEQVAAALQGPFAGMLAAASMTPSVASGEGRPVAPPGQPADPVAAAQAASLLASDVPTRFIATGAALTAALAALSRGDDVQTAGALICAQRLLFPGDAAGAAAVSRACQGTLARLRSGSFGWTPPSAQPHLASEALQVRISGGMAALERAFLSALPAIEAAALSTRSWLAITGGAGPESGAAQIRYGPFVGGLLRWAFFTEAALESVRHDDWATVGACLLAARRDVQHGSGDAAIYPM